MSTADPATFEGLFRTTDGARDNFLARLFGIFNEDVVRHWCRNPAATYEDLGRPTVFTQEGCWHTLDFTLRDRRTGRTYASEMKCELSFEGYRYLRLVGSDQLDHHAGAAFQRFLELSRPGHGLVVKVAGRPTQVDGAILVWGATTESGERAVRERFGLADVLSVEQMISDLHRWDDEEWAARTATLRRWCNELFEFLNGKAVTPQ